MHSDSVPVAGRIGNMIGGKYLVRRLIGVGGMGAVYEAENTWTNRLVAIKRMRVEFTHNDEATQRFVLEARSAAHASHPNVVDVLDMGADADGSLYIVQELLTGADLRAQLDRRGRFDPASALALITPIMRALVSMHARGIVHRDIKPEHIILVEDATGQVTPKLIDFGIAKADGVDAMSGSRAGHPVGTPHYMSPEQARGDVEIDGRADVWSVGAVLYEMLTGRVPVDAPNYELLVHRLLSATPARIELLAPHLPPALADVVHMALEPDRDRRFASMEAFLDALLEQLPAFNDVQLPPVESSARLVSPRPRVRGNSDPTLEGDSMDDLPTGVHKLSAANAGPARGLGRKARRS